MNLLMMNDDDDDESRASSRVSAISAARKVALKNLSVNGFGVCIQILI